MEKVVNSLIVEVKSHQARINNLDYVMGLYHDWKGDSEKFGKFLSEKIEELTKNRTNDSVSDK